MSLNAEPSQPEERAEHDLPPKPYVEAAKEGLNGVNGAANSATNGATNGSIYGSPNGDALGAPDEASFGAVETPLEEEAPPKPREIRTNGRVTAEEYTGSGRDEAPHSPTRHTHKRVRSKPSNQLMREYQKHREPALVVEQYRAGDGAQLVTAKAPDNYETEHREDTMKKVRQDPAKGELVSGRRAGAGWERSR